MPEAFEFRLVGEERLDGRSAQIIGAVPRADYQPRSRTAGLFRSMKGRFWVDQQDHQIVKVEAEVINAISVGSFLVRVAKGSRATLEMACAGDGVWLPDRLRVFASDRLGLFMALRFEQRTEYSRYRGIPADARAIYPGVDRRTTGIELNRLAKAATQ